MLEEDFLARSWPEAQENPADAWGSRVGNGKSVWEVKKVMSLQPHLERAGSEQKGFSIPSFLGIMSLRDSFGPVFWVLVLFFSQSSMLFPVSEGVKVRFPRLDQAELGLEQPCQVEGVPAHGEGLE